LASSVPASSNPAATAVPVTVGPGTPQPTGTVSAAGITATFPLGTCSVTVSRTVRLREEPTTSSKILTRLAYNTTWQATERIPGWFRVVWQDTQGWVSSDYVRATGSCGR
ncbi:MAG: SH3 domain-containing protein, partial [Anaerolineae bacterium]|nr:SH3 domain-containing protein [Anaerolineae bacterium]